MYTFAPVHASGSDLQNVALGISSFIEEKRDTKAKTTFLLLQKEKRKRCLFEYIIIPKLGNVNNKIPILGKYVTLHKK